MSLLSLSQCKMVLIPSDFIGNVKEDIKILLNNKFDYQNQRIRLAANRCLCALGMVLASFVSGLILWNLLINSIKIVIQLSICSGIYLTCRILFARFATT